MNPILFVSVSFLTPGLYVWVPLQDDSVPAVCPLHIFRHTHIQRLINTEKLDLLPADVHTSAVWVVSVFPALLLLCNQGSQEISLMMCLSASTNVSMHRSTGLPSDSQEQGG